MKPANLGQLIESARKNAKTKPEDAVKRHSVSDSKTLAAFIDHTLLKAEGTQEQIEKLCSEATKYHFKAVCVNSSFIPFASKALRNSGVLPITVVGFPLGAALTKAKVFEAKEAIDLGAKEIDTVINVGSLKSGSYDYVLNDISSVVEASSVPVKVIIETSLLTEDEKIIASILSREAGASFVKTSTGFAGGGATVEDIKLIRSVVGPEMKIKASGGVKTFRDAIKMIEAGADRIGSSASVNIINESSF